MGDFDDAFINSLKQQSWSLYGVGMFIILLRFFARIKRLGPRNLQLDDYLMLLVAGLYTTLVVCLNVISQGGGSNLYPPELAGTFTPVEIQERIYGSKIVVVSEQAMLNVIYAIKCCMLVMYTRLTLGLATQRLVRYLALYVGVGWAASEIAFFAACRPFAAYWAMPPPDPQCATLEHYAIVQACFNISSDALMLSVPLPLVFRTTMPVRQKVVLGVIFGMGLFVIVAALLTKIFNLGDIWDPSYMLWYVREASVAVYVSNMPMVWPLLREWLPWLKGLTPGGSSSRGKKGFGSGRNGAGGGYVEYGSRKGGGTGTETTRRDGEGTRTGTVRGRPGSLGSLDSAYDLDVVTESGKEGVKYKGGDSESTEQIVTREEIDIGTREGRRDSIGLAIMNTRGIQVRRTVEVLEERHGSEAGMRSRDYVVDVEAAKDGFEWEMRRTEHEASVARGRL